jgi:hypothetical protein
MPPSPEADLGAYTLAETAARLTAADEHLRLVVGPPSGDGWVLVADALASPSIFDAWFERVRTTVQNGRTDVAGSYLASFVGSTIAAPLVRALVTQRRGWRAAAGSTWLHMHDEGWIDQVATAAPVLVLPADTAAHRADVEVVEDLDALVALAIEHLVGVVAPVFAAVRARAPYGLRGMWGALADSIAAELTWSAQVGGHDVVDAWRRAQPILDALVVAAPTRVTRPTFERIDAAGHVAHLTIRGTCCLYFQSLPPGAPADYCTSCPMGDVDTRRARRQQWLRRHLALDED